MRKIIILTLLILLLINFLYVFSGVVHFPLRSIDVYSIWLFKAKAFYIENGFPFETLNNPEYKYSHPQYPILLPWLFSLIYKSIGGVKEVYVLVLYPFVYVAILYVIYKLLRIFGLNNIKSLSFVYVYSMFGPLLAQAGRNHAGTADIFVVLVNWIIVYLSSLLFKDKKKLYLGLIIALLVAISSQIKMEGIFFAAIIIFLPVNRKYKLVWFVIALLPTLVWFYISRKIGINPSFSFELTSVEVLFERVLIIVDMVIKEMLNVNNWYIFWPLFFLITFTITLKSKFMHVLITPSLRIISLLFVVVYLTSTIDLRAYLHGSLDRVLFQLTPFFYLIFVLKFEVFINKFLLQRSHKKFSLFLENS